MRAVVHRQVATVDLGKIELCNEQFLCFYRGLIEPDRDARLRVFQRVESLLALGTGKAGRFGIWVQFGLLLDQEGIWGLATAMSGRCNIGFHRAF